MILLFVGERMPEQKFSNIGSEFFMAFVVFPQNTKRWLHSLLVKGSRKPKVTNAGQKAQTFKKFAKAPTRA